MAVFVNPRKGSFGAVTRVSDREERAQARRRDSAIFSLYIYNTYVYIYKYT